MARYWSVNGLCRSNIYRVFKRKYRKSGILMCSRVCLRRVGGICLVILAFVLMPIVILLGSDPVPVEQGKDAEAELSDINKHPLEPYPKIIHQVWLGFDNKDPPEAWHNATLFTRATNPDYSYRHWSSDDVIELLTTHYAWFLPTYHSYPYNVERADAARYFIILHHGGIYLDMDEISIVPVTDIIATNNLQKYDCMLPAGTPNGITNYVIMCKKQSPFMRYLTLQLGEKAGWYGVPYATVMWSTGPRFVSGVYDRYENKASLYVMPGDDVTRNFLCLFGQSWFSIDGVLLHIIVYPFIRLGISWSYLVIMILLVILAIILFVRNIRVSETLPRQPGIQTERV